MQEGQKGSKTIPNVKMSLKQLSNVQPAFGNKWLRYIHQTTV